MATNNGIPASEIYVKNAITQLSNELSKKITELEREMINLAENVVREIQNQTSSLGKVINGQTDQLSLDISQQTGQLSSNISQQTGQLSSNIDKQTLALVAQAIAQIKILHDCQGEIATTNTKIALQTEAELQIEIVKKVGAYLATKSKLTGLAQDIESRFGKAYESVYINRQLYNAHFQSILDEYSNKIKSIASHIYEIVENDIAPAIEAANRPQIQIYELPVEVDLLRLKSRAECLDGTLQLLRSTRLDDVLLAMNKLRTRIEDCYKLDGVSQNSEKECAVEGLLVSANGSETLLVESLVSSVNVQGESIVHLSPPEDDFKKYYDTSNVNAAAKAVLKRSTRKPSAEEIQELKRAATELQSENMISKESLELFNQFMNLNLLKLTE